MCLFCIRIRGVKVLGRQLYRTDTGVKLGYRGPTVPLESVYAELSYPTAMNVRDSIAAIDLKIESGQIDVNRYAPASLLSANDADGPWYADENPALYAAAADVGLSCLPPDVACREYENTGGHEIEDEREDSQDDGPGESDGPSRMPE